MRAFFVLINNNNYLIPYHSYRKGDFVNTQQIVWIAVMIIFTVVELCTLNMITIWLVLGALAALIGCILGASVMAQMWIFVIVSVLALAVTKPIVSKKLHQKRISPGKFAGKVMVNGQEWSAVAKDGASIPEGASVTVIEISGVKLIVE